MKRPFVVYALISILFIVCSRWWFADWWLHREYPMGDWGAEGVTGQVSGVLAAIEQKDSATWYYLKDCIVSLSGQAAFQNCEIDSFLVKVSYSKSENIFTDNQKNTSRQKKMPDRGNIPEQGSEPDWENISEQGNEENRGNVPEQESKPDQENISEQGNEENRGNVPEQGSKPNRGSISEQENTADIILGAQIHATGEILTFEAASNPGQFDSRAYYGQRNLFYQMCAKNIDVQDTPDWTFRQMLWELRRYLAGRMDVLWDERDAGVVKAMLLGEKDGLDSEIKSLYTRNGIGHLLAISGLHMALFAMGAYGLLSYMGLSGRLCGGICIVVLFAYGFLTGLSVATNRAMLMMTLFFLAKILGRAFDRKNALGFAAVIILWQTPAALYGSSFLLSFGAMAGVCYICPACRELFLGRAKDIRRWKKYKKRLAGENPYRKMRWHAAGFAIKVVDSLAFSLGIQLATLPVIAWFYFEIPSYGVFLNLLVIPLMGVLVATVVFAVFLGEICLPAAKIPIWVSHSILQLYDKLCRTAECLPGSRLVTGKPQMWQILLYYGVLAVCILGWRLYRKKVEGNWGFKRQVFAAGITDIGTLATQKGGSQHAYKDKKEKGTLAVWAVRMFAAFKNGVWIVHGPAVGKDDGQMTAGKPWCGRRSFAGLAGIFVMVCILLPGKVRNFQMTFLDVGQGDCIFFQTEGGAYLVDGGSTSVSSVGQYRILPYLKSQAVKRLDYVWISHLDKDHMNGVEELLAMDQGIEVGTLFLSETSYYEPEAETLRSLCREKQVQMRIMQRGDWLRKGELAVRCLYPEKAAMGKYDKNDWSQVLLVEYAGERILLTGDLGVEGEERLMENGELPSVTVLKAGHHGSKYSSGEQFLQAAGAEIAVFSVGKKNRYGHPHTDTIERMEKCGMQWISTAQAGAVFLQGDAGGLRMWGYIQ